MTFSIRQMLIVTVALAILIATVTSLFSLKQTRLEIAIQQQQVAETKQLVTVHQFEAKKVDGEILMRTIENDILKDIVDPKNTEQHLARIQEKILANFQPADEMVRLVRLPSLTGIAYQIYIPKSKRVSLKFAAFENLTEDTQQKKFVPPYENFAELELLTGIHRLEVPIVESKESKLQQTKIMFDQTLFATHETKSTGKGTSSVSSSNPNGQVALHDQLLNFGQRIVEVSGEHAPTNTYYRWKLWLSDTPEEASDSKPNP